MERCWDAGGDIAKVVFTNLSVNDLGLMRAAARKVNNKGRRYSLMGMGPYGHLSRILSPIMGCEMVYASLDEPGIQGQMNIRNLRIIWSDMRIDKENEW